MRAPREHRDRPDHPESEGADALDAPAPARKSRDKQAIPPHFVCGERADGRVLYLTGNIVKPLSFHRRNAIRWWAPVEAQPYVQNFDAYCAHFGFEMSGPGGVGRDEEGGPEVPASPAEGEETAPERDERLRREDAEQQAVHAKLAAEVAAAEAKAEEAGEDEKPTTSLRGPPPSAAHRGEGKSGKRGR